MIRYEVKGSGQYLSKGVRYLEEHGYAPSPEDAELLICLAHPEILKRDTLDRYKYGCINFHAGLPKYRGRHPLQWMLIDGVPNIPVAVHRMDEGIDTGPIIAQDQIPVSRDETYESALDKVTDAVGPLLERAFVRILANEPVYEQNPAEFGYARRRTPDDSLIDWGLPSQRVHRFINALAHPMPNAYDKNGRYHQSYSGVSPGEIIAHCTDGRVVIACGEGVVLVRMSPK